MKIVLKIGLTLMLTAAVFAANAQWRPYPYGYPNRYQRLQQNMERNNNRDQYVYQKNTKPRLLLNLNYGISMPLGSLHDYTGKTSFTGWNGSLLYQINPQLAAGLGVGYYDYYQKIPRQVYQDKTTAISAVQSRTLQLIPIQPTLVYTPKGDKPGVKPYVGLGIGVSDVNYAKYWGEFVESQNKVAFSVSPMAGVQIPFSQKSPLALNVGVKYNYVPYNYNEIKNISTVEGNIGLSIHLK